MAEQGAADEALWQKVKDFASLPPTDATRDALLAEAPLHTIAQLLVDGSKAETVCRCISKLVSGGRDDILYAPDGVGLLRAGIEHNNRIVRAATIGLIKGMTSRADGLACVISSGLLAAVGGAVRDRELSVSNAASGAILGVAAQGGAGLAAVFDECGPLFEDIMGDGGDGEVQLRGLELVARLWSVGGEEGAGRCRATSAKGRLEELLGSDDVLLQLNAVEILSLLPAADVEGLMPRLLSTAEEVTGGAVPARLLDCVARYIAEQRGGGREGQGDAIGGRLCVLLRERLEGAKGEELVDGLNALCTLCNTGDGLAALAGSPEYPRVAGSLPDHVRSLQQPVRLSALCALGRAAASLASVPPGGVPDLDNKGGCLGRAAASIAPFLLKLAQSPVQEERTGALFALEGVCLHAWGVQAAACVEGFLAHIMDRRVETSKRALEEKFAVARACAACERLGDIVGPEQAGRLIAFVAEGPFVVMGAGRGGDAVPQVATQKA